MRKYTLRYLSHFSLKVYRFTYFIYLNLYVATLSRRKLLLSSLSVVILSLILISISFVLLNSYPNSRGGSIMALLSLCMYLAGFSPGLGTLPWVINSELHPGWCRAQANMNKQTVHILCSCDKNWIFSSNLSLTKNFNFTWLAWSAYKIIYKGLLIFDPGNKFGHCH